MADKAEQSPPTVPAQPTENKPKPETSTKNTTESPDAAAKDVSPTAALTAASGKCKQETKDAQEEAESTNSTGKLEEVDNSNEIDQKPTPVVAVTALPEDSGASPEGSSAADIALAPVTTLKLVGDGSKIGEDGPSQAPIALSTDPDDAFINADKPESPPSIVFSMTPVTTVDSAPIAAKQIENATESEVNMAVLGVVKKELKTELGVNLVEIANALKTYNEAVQKQVADDARRLNITIAESDERICNVQHMIENQNDIIYQLSKQKEEFLSMNGDNRAAIDELKNSLKFQTQPAPREPLSSQTKKVNPHGALSENIEKAKKQCKALARELFSSWKYPEGFLVKTNKKGGQFYAEVAYQRLHSIAPETLMRTRNGRTLEWNSLAELYRSLQQGLNEGEEKRPRAEGWVRRQRTEKKPSPGSVVRFLDALSFGID